MLTLQTAMSVDYKNLCTKHTSHWPSVLSQDEALPPPPPQPTTADQAAPLPKKSTKRSWIGRKPKVVHQSRCLSRVISKQLLLDLLWPLLHV